MMMSERRRERRQQTIDEVVATALDVMAESGAAGLSLGEVAKRMGIRTPSLYGYFPSKAALCDEIFARGWRELGEAMQRRDTVDDGTVPGTILRSVSTFVGWALDHRAYAELMFWRPIPGWEPAPGAYTAAVAVLDALHDTLVTMQRRGQLRPDASASEMRLVLTVLTTGVISQQLSNEPNTPAAQGRYAAALPRLVAMFLHEFGPGEIAGATQSPSDGRRAHR